MRKLPDWASSCHSSEKGSSELLCQCLDTPSLCLVYGPMAHPSFTSEYLSHVTHALKTVKAAPPCPTLYQSQQPRKLVPNLTPGKPNTNCKAATGFVKKSQERLQMQIGMAPRNNVSTFLQSIWGRKAGRFGNIYLELDKCLSCFACFKRHSRKEQLSVFQVAGRFQLDKVDGDINRVEVQIHDATVICIHPKVSQERSSSQQPIWKPPFQAGRPCACSDWGDV